MVEAVHSYLQNNVMLFTYEAVKSNKSNQNIHQSMYAVFLMVGG